MKLSHIPQPAKHEKQNVHKINATADEAIILYFEITDVCKVQGHQHGCCCEIKDKGAQIEPCKNNNEWIKKYSFDRIPDAKHAAVVALCCSSAGDMLADIAHCLVVFVFLQFFFDREGIEREQKTKETKDYNSEEWHKEFLEGKSIKMLFFYLFICSKTWIMLVMTITEKYKTFVINSKASNPFTNP